MRLERERRWNLGLVGRVDTPGTLPLFEGTHLVGYLYLCPRSSYRYDYHHKKSALFIFIHPKIGITYVVSLSIPLRFICPPSILRWNSNSPPTNYYFVTALLLIWWMSPSMFLLRILQELSIQPHLLHPPCFSPFEAPKGNILLPFLLMSFHVRFLFFHSLFVYFESPNFV